MTGQGEWADAYAKAKDFVSQMTLLEKVNLTTGVGWEGEQCVGQVSLLSKFSELLSDIERLEPFLDWAFVLFVCRMLQLEYVLEIMLVFSLRDKVLLPLLIEDSCMREATPWARSTRVKVFQLFLGQLRDLLDVILKVDEIGRVSHLILI